MSDQERDPVAVDDRRRRIVRRVFLVGPVLGIVGAAALGVAGLDGRAGFASVLVLTGFGAVSGALVGIGTAIVDEARGHPVSRGRLVQIGLLVALALFTMIALAALSD